MNGSRQSLAERAICSPVAAAWPAFILYPCRRPGTAAAGMRSPGLDAGV